MFSSIWFGWIDMQLEVSLFEGGINFWKRSNLLWCNFNGNWDSCDVLKAFEGVDGIILVFYVHKIERNVKVGTKNHSNCLEFEFLHQFDHHFWTTPKPNKIHKSNLPHNHSKPRQNCNNFNKSHNSKS